MLLHTDDGILFSQLHLGGSHVTNFYFAVSAIDEDVITLDIAMNNWWIM
jgi:hypothetical protein